MSETIKKGSVNQTTYVFIQDNSLTTGEGLTGLVFNSAGLTCYYVRPLAAAVAISLVTQTVTGAHTDGGFVEIDVVNMKGIYRLDLPDAVPATGVDTVTLHLRGATNMAPTPHKIQLTSFDLQTASVPQTADHTTAIADIPTVAEFNARTILSANYALATALATAQLDLDTITGVDGVTLATLQALYAPSKAGDAMTLTPAATSAQLVDDIVDEDISKANHNVPNSLAKITRQGGDLVQIDGVVSDASPSVTDFDTNLSYVDGYFEDAVLIFSDGAANAGIGRPVVDYLNANGNMAFLAPDDWPVTPVNGDDFVIFATHVHPISQIQASILSDATPFQGADVGAIKAKTEKLTFTVANNVDSNTLLINGDSQAVINYERSATALQLGAAIAGTLSITEMTTDLTEATDDHYNGRIIVWTTGVLKNQATDITDYDGATKKLTYTATTDAPSATDEFVIA